MKVFNILIIVFFLVACNNAVPPEKKLAKKEKSPVTKPMEKWLTLTGEKGMPHIVFISGDEEYRSEEALPQLAKILSQRHGFKSTVLFAQDPNNPGIVDANHVGNIPGLEHLQTADLMVIFTRFRALPDDQMKHIDDYLKSGKPVIGMRTSTHGFNFSEVDFESKFKHYGNFYDGDDVWKGGFGRLVMGEKWISHHGKHGDQSTKGILASDAKNHPILNGIGNGEIWGATDVYGVRLPLPGDAQPLVLGQVTERSLASYDDDDPLFGMRPSDNKLPDLIAKDDDKGIDIRVNQNDPMMPVAWTKSFQLPEGKKGMCFATTMGASTDLLQEGTRRMIVNAAFWCLDKKVPAKADVSLVGQYKPTRFVFLKDEHWDEVKMKISDLR